MVFSSGTSFEIFENMDNFNKSDDEFEILWLLYGNFCDNLKIKENPALMTNQLLLCCWHVIREAIWYVTNVILGNIHFDFFQRTKLRQPNRAETAACKFEICNFEISSNSFSYDMPATLVQVEKVQIRKISRKIVDKSEDNVLFAIYERENNWQNDLFFTEVSRYLGYLSESCLVSRWQLISYDVHLDLSTNQENLKENCW